MLAINEIIWFSLVFRLFNKQQFVDYFGVCISFFMIFIVPVTRMLNLTSEEMYNEICVFLTIYIGKYLTLRKIFTSNLDLTKAQIYNKYSIICLIMIYDIANYIKNYYKK